MSDQWIFIRPNDVWLFRDNKPFSARQNFVARGQFPPNPQVMQGVVRSYSYFNGKPIGDANNMGGLTVEGPYVAKMGNTGKITRYFPMPMDVRYEEDIKRLCYLSVDKKRDFQTSEPFEGWRPLNQPPLKEPKDDTDELEEPPTSWLSEESFRTYLAGKEIQPFEDKPKIGEVEERVGLALDYSRRANQQSMFYHAQFTRLHDDVGLLIKVNYTENIFGDSGTIGIGGESRFGHYQQVAEPASLITQTKGNLKVILLTPAYFSDGWQPQNGDWSPFVGKGKLVSVALGKAQAISGWDIANNRPKPLRHFVPAGSVFYFENAEWQNNAFSESANGSPYHQMGFGTVATSSW
jgi:CRISPR-associated protein Cmr3